MTPSLTDQREALRTLLDVGLDGIDTVYDHESNREQSGPVYLTVELERLTPTEQVWAVRIYSQTADSIGDGAHRMDVALEAVDDCLASAGQIPSEWQVGHVDDIGALVARSFLSVPRETF